MDLPLPPRYALDPDRPLLGEGGMGRVFLVRDVILDVPVALKVVRPDLAVDVRFRRLFDQEVRVAARFTHPNIVPLHDLGELGDGTPFLGLALADAGSFANLRDEALAWSELLRLTLELLDALGHLHARGVLHRDLKPENILLFTGEDGARHVWLADLGLANASSQLARRKGRVEGTPGFMAPEQKLGLPREYGPWTDLFSLGVILWDIITGELPFPEGRSPLDAELPALLPREGIEIPEGLDQVLANLLSAEPLSRYDLAADLRRELEALGEACIDSDRIRAGMVGAPGVPRVGTLATAAHRSTSGAFRVDESGGLKVLPGVPLWNRPRPKPIPAHPVAEPRVGATARASVPLFSVRELPLVARESHREQLWALARSVIADGRSRVAVVVGEAGSGKTMLVEDLARTLEEGGWSQNLFLTWQRPAGAEDGYAGAARTILRPWNETRESLETRLRRSIARERGVLDAAVHADASQLARWCGLSRDGEDPVPAGIGLREVYRWLEARSWRGMSCLGLEQAQYAVEDGDGLDIAESVLHNAEEGRSRRLLVVVTVRSEALAQDAELNERLQLLFSHGAVRIDLPRLDRSGTEALLAEMLNLDPSLSRMVAERCEGNPLFARQLLQEWATRGWLVDTGGLVFGLAPGVDANAALPADAEALFRARVQAAADASDDPVGFLDAVHAIALAGEVVPRGVFENLAGNDASGFLRGCGLWSERDERLRFDHGLLHQTVRGDASNRRDRDALHRRVAEAWLSFGQTTGAEVAFEVGRHAQAGGDSARAVEYLLQAADSAWRRGRTPELEEAARLALAAIDDDPQQRPQAGWARLWLGRAWQARGAAREADSEFREAHAAFQAAAQLTGVATALVGLGWAAREAGELPRSEKLYKEAMRLAKAQNDLRAEAESIAGLAWVEQQKRNFEGADILFTRVLNRFTSLGDARGAAEATLGQAFVARRKGAFDEAEELYQEAAANFSANGDALGVARATVGRAVVLRQRMRASEAENLFREAIALADELGAVGIVMDGRLGLAEMARVRGQYDRARQLYAAHVRWAERANLAEPAIFSRLGAAMAALMVDDAQAMYEQSLAASEHLARIPGHWLWAPYRLVVATMLALRRDEAETYRWLWSASELGLGDTVDHDHAHLLTTLCAVAQQQRWVNVVKLASKLAIAQWERLGHPEQARTVAAMARAVLEGG